MTLPVAQGKKELKEKKELEEHLPPVAPQLDPKADMSFMQHLGVLRGHIFRSVVWLLVAACGAAFLTLPAWDLMLQPLCGVMEAANRVCMVYPHELMEMFWVYMKLGTLLAVLIASPALILEMWAFVSPGLYKHEKRMLIPASLIFGLLFSGGAVFGFLVVLPPTFHMMISSDRWGMGHYEMKLSAERYFSLCATLLIAFGCLFELPLLMSGISWLGLVKPRWFKRYRRVCWWLILLLAAAVTPSTDPVTFLIMAIPMIILYEVGVIASRFLYKPRLWREGDGDPA